MVTKLALIQNNIVENVILAGEDFNPPDGYVAIDVTEMAVGPGWGYNDGVFTPPVPAPQPPDGGALMEAVFFSMGKQAARAFARQYPDLIPAIERERWDLLREAVDDALEDEFIDQTTYDALQNLMTEYNIPENETPE